MGLKKWEEGGGKEMRVRIPLIMLLVVAGLMTVLMFPNKVNAADNTKPRVVISKYEIENGGVNSGEPAKVKITLKNMSTSHAVNSVLLTCVNSSNYFSAEYGTSNQGYIDSLAPSEEKQVQISLTAKEGIDIGSLMGNINISYIDDAGQAYSSDSQIVIPVKGNELQLSKVYVPDSVVVDEKSKVNITCQNFTNKEIYNVTVKVKGDNSKETSASIGKLLIGSRQSQEMYIAFDTIGSHQVTVQLSYKDANGTSYQMTPHEYQVNVVKANVVNANNQNSNSKNVSNTASKYIPLIKELGYVAAIIICALLAVEWLRRKNNN